MVRRMGFVVGVALALCCLLAPSALGAKKPKKVKDTTTWLCKPGIPDNPCAPGFDTTMISPSGQVVGTAKPKSDPNRKKIDCFYVYPTVSDDKSVNSDLSIDPEERSIALYQAARYGLDCRVFAPMYRQVTVQALLSGSISPDAAQIAYGDVLAAWKTYLHKYNDGRGVVLIGHSQGTAVLRELVHQAIDPKKKVRKLLVSAILLGGNVTVAAGQKVGGDFKKIPGCTKAKQFGCVMAFSTFDAPVPSDSLFGRPGFGGLTPPGLPTTGDVLCTNPAALAGGSALLTSIFPSQPFAPGTTIGTATLAVGQSEPGGLTTPWFQQQGYNGACDSANDAHVLQVSAVGGAPTLHAVPDATWGLHFVDANIALGNLTADVSRQAKAWLGKNAKPKKKR